MLHSLKQPFQAPHLAFDTRNFKYANRGSSGTASNFTASPPKSELGEYFEPDNWLEMMMMMMNEIRLSISTTRAKMELELV